MQSCADVIVRIQEYKEHTKYNVSVSRPTQADADENGNVFWFGSVDGAVKRKWDGSENSEFASLWWPVSLDRKVTTFKRHAEIE